MTPLDVSTILGNTTRPMFHVGLLSVERGDARSFFSVDPLVAFLHLSVGANVYADLPCPQHVRRHLRQWDASLTDIPREISEPECSGAADKFGSQIPELRELAKYQVWRQGDDGNEMPVGSPTTKRDADCWVQELESHGHKQIYWSSVANS